MKEVETVVIVGPNMPFCYKDYEGDERYLVIGDGKRDISLDEIEKSILAARLSQDVSIVLNMHGGNLIDEASKEPYHVLQVSTSTDPSASVPTKRFLEIFEEALERDSKARICNRACNSGTSIKDANVLPSGVTYYTLSDGSRMFAEFVEGE